MFKKFNAGKVGLFVAGLAFGTAGIKIHLTRNVGESFLWTTVHAGSAKKK